MIGSEADMDIGRRIRAQMVLSGLGPRDMARAFRITERTWRNWMREPKDQITVGRLEVIAAVLHTTPQALMEEES